MLLKTLLIFALFSTSAIAKNKKKPWSYLYTPQNCTSDAKKDPKHLIWSRRFNPNKDESRKDEIAGGLGGARRYSLMLPTKVDKGTPEYCLWMYFGTQGTGQNDQAQVVIDSDIKQCWNFDAGNDRPPPRKRSRMKKRRGGGNKGEGNSNGGGKGEDETDDDEEAAPQHEDQGDDENHDQGDNQEEQSPVPIGPKGLPTVGRGPYGSFRMTKGGCSKQTLDLIPIPFEAWS